MFLCWSQIAQRHWLVRRFLSAFRTAIQESANVYLSEFHIFPIFPRADLNMLVREKNLSSGVVLVSVYEHGYYIGTQKQFDLEAWTTRN